MALDPPHCPGNENIDLSRLIPFISPPSKAAQDAVFDDDWSVNADVCLPYRNIENEKCTAWNLRDCGR